MLRLIAPAKLNLTLRVLGKRPDGYHELETLFERIDLCDELTFSPAPHNLSLTCDRMSCGEDNLVMKAARLLQREAEMKRGAAIHLVKRIPVAAGIGGGSSDAAATLRGLNQLWKLGMSVERLKELGMELGSDVPVFLEDAPFVIGRDRGDRGERLDGIEVTIWHVLVVPRQRLSTADIFDAFDARVGESSLTAVPSSINIATHALRNGSLAELAKGLHNDLQPEAIRRCPVIADILSCLKELGCLASCVSGSGSAVFGLCDGADSAQTIADSIRPRAPEFGDAHVVRTWMPA